MTLIFAHRGAAGTYPENTMISFEAAESLRQMELSWMFN